jgi:cell wall-associated NlpC family hydrolase
MQFSIKTILLFIFSLSLATYCLGDEINAGTHAGTVVSTPNGLQLRQTDISDSKPQRNLSYIAQEVMMQALSLTGIPYKYGGANPETGLDCSGFVRYVFAQAANLALPHSARAISQLGESIRREDLQPGDLVFFNTLKSAYSHVGIYLGDNKFIHAPKPGAVVRTESLSVSYWLSRFNGARRVNTGVSATDSNALPQE